MYLIVGLGNPEAEYARTRHNMGVDVVNELADKYKIAISREKFDGLYGTGEIENEKVILLKPQTYMNLSGDSVIQFANFYKLNPEEIIVIYDDIDTNPGKIRIRKKGGPGTHNGMKSVVSRLNSEDFPRVRVGIGMPEFKGDLVNYVIGNITDEDYEELEDASDYKKLLLNGEYALHFAIGKTYEGAEKVEFIDGKKYILNHYLDDIYEDNSTIKDIGELSLNVDNLIGLLFDFEEEDEEIVISVVDFEHGGGLSNPRIREVDDSGDIENILKELIEKFSE